MAKDTNAGFEGHGDPGSPKPTVSKGEFISNGGTYADLSTTSTSVNSKTGHIGDGEQREP